MPRARFAATLLAAVAAATTSLVAAPTALATNPATRPSQPVTYTAEVGGVYQITHPGQPWPGVDDWSCQPSPEHPRPVILLHGTGANGVNNWGTIAPALLNEGYCVFAPTYGATPLFPGIGATLRMAEHVDEMTAYLDRVLDATGADQADVVGHSQGVTVGMHLAKVTRPDRISTVASLGGFAGGTAEAGLPGLASLATVVDLEGLAAENSRNLPDGPLPMPFPSMLDINQHSPIGQLLFNGGSPFHDGTRYTLIASALDGLVQPEMSFPAGDHPGVTTHVLQNTCRQNGADHAALYADPQTVDLVLNALNPDNAVTPRCWPTTPIVGALGAVPARGAVSSN
ncbi:alpha/beta fold hydrolase [Dietzia sp. SLG310A2-38A2]|uniref:alpha/beta fold hydrolase n=1 Tax=Dietzia sp. SLG310A2-38A2 TaxID=1630643 RepID=UPI0015FA20A8|nr:alpha/beta fold hydrolase [Dietzia sp. SLG310A2-38A2]MBB1031893.1 alpha/beta fold hydrolase [Dietzia sp. SLG310A2-38A2]